MSEEREILLRIWDKVNKKMIYDPIVDGATGGVYVIDYGNLVAMLSRDCYVLMQYTGLKDIDGNKIFEGDILEDPTTDFKSGEADRCVVEYYNQYARFGLEFYSIYGGEGYTGYTQHIHQYVKGHRIIGNIHQNRELLKK
jgi:uncharacterized phage protein (TIGR01671 family)